MQHVSPVVNPSSAIAWPLFVLVSEPAHAAHHALPTPRILCSVLVQSLPLHALGLLRLALTMFYILLVL